MGVPISLLTFWTWKWEGRIVSGRRNSASHTVLSASDAAHIWLWPCSFPCGPLRMSQASPDPSSPGFCPPHQGSGDLIFVLLGRGRSCLDIFASGLPRWHSTSSKEPACQGRRHKRCGFDPWVGKIPWRRAWKPTLVFLPGESHGQRSLAGCSP